MLSPIIIAVDCGVKDALNLVKKLNPDDCKLNVGSQLFTAEGPKIVKNFQDKGFDVFLDLKFHDIPSTVHKAVKSAAELGVWMVNVHASGGGEMLEAAKSALENSAKKPLLIGVTLLTSLDKSSLKEIGCNSETEDQVLLLAKLCKDKNLSGAVCSPKETANLRKQLGEDFILVTPGIRSIASPKDDQKRTTTPITALKNGANYIVLGRDITLGKDPQGSVKQILENISY